MKKGTNIQDAADTIEKGEPVAFSTETVYGLGADAFNPKAVASIFEVKRRPSFNPLIVHTAKYSQRTGIGIAIIDRLNKAAYRFSNSNVDKNEKVL
ncbi:MAG: Sua5/YciO/YrdC/YwlC family protein [Bacteroidales bacterium]